MSRIKENLPVVILGAIDVIVIIIYIIIVLHDNHNLASNQEVPVTEIMIEDSTEIESSEVSVESVESTESSDLYDDITNEDGENIFGDLVIEEVVQDTEIEESEVSEDVSIDEATVDEDVSIQDSTTR